jgi:KRAB domain-containing zinc finger protein
MCLFRVYGVQDGTIYSTSSSPSSSSSPTLLTDHQAQLSGLNKVTIKNEPYYDQENGEDGEAILPAEPECLLKLETDECTEKHDDKSRNSPDVEIATVIEKKKKNKPKYDKSSQEASTSKKPRTNDTTPGSSSSVQFHYCNHCHTPFETLNNLQAHVTAYHTPICCLYCGQEFATKAELERHEYGTHNKQSWGCQARAKKSLAIKCPCPICKKEFPINSLEVHVRKHTLRYPCSICDRNFAYKNSLDRHIEKKHRTVDGELEPEPKKRTTDLGSKLDRSCICELCGKLYKGPKGLSYHMLLHTGEHPHVCQQCGQAFIYKNSLTSHMIREHGVTSPFICSICGKVFLSKTALDDHERKHTGERPYSCDICNKTFSSKAHLSTHKYDHIETEMKCNLCEEIFTKRNEYYRHRARYHLPPRKKNHQCAICGIAVTSRKALDDHLRVHTKEKPFECEICNKRFGQKDLVTMHIKSHLQIRPNKCSTCGKCFPNKQALVVHERIHTGERPHVCRVCYQSFNQINSLKRHLKLHNAKYHMCNYCGRDFDVKTELRIHHRNDHGLHQSQ